MNDKNSIIKDLNEKFGTNLNKADELLLEHIKSELLSNEVLIKKATTLPIKEFRDEFNRILIKIVKSKIQDNSECFTKIINDKKFYMKNMLTEIYKMLKNTAII